MKYSRIAIVPAKGKSVRIKNKNIKKFNGRPIINYTLDALKKSRLFKKIHVSTESKKVKKIVNNFGIKIDFLRPKKLATDTTILNDVLKFVLREYKKLDYQFDEIWLIYPCNPFLNKNLLNSAAKSFKKKNNIPLMTIKEYEAPIEWALSKKKNYFIPLSQKNLLIDSKKIKKKYYESGSFVIFKQNQIINKKIHSKYNGFILNREKAVDIDTIEDWKLAENLYKLKT
tara:strand:- start:243 stop:926 length:684 start_codon:yes stop_codon:yes gene_type:complete